MSREGTLSKRSVYGLVCLLGLAAPSQIGLGQNLFRPAPRPLKIRLVRAREAIDEARYTDAITLLGEILVASARLDDDSAGQDFFYDTAGDATARRSIKTLAELWIGELPKSARELFELKYGGAARGMVDQAIDSRDLRLLNEVTRKYFHTQAGHEACMILGRRHLDAGRPFASAMIFDRVLRSSQSERFEPQASLLCAMSLQLAGLPERAEEVLRKFRARNVNEQFALGSDLIQLFDENESPLAWLNEHLGQPNEIRQSAAMQWAMHRGGADRNATSMGGMPLVNYRWRTPVSIHPEDERLLRDIRRQNEVQGAPTIPTISPLAVGDTVLIRSARRLMAIDFASGKRVWEFPWDDTPDEQANAAMKSQVIANNGSLRHAELHERILEDSLYGQLAAENDSVFFVSELGYASSSSSPYSTTFGGVRAITQRTAKAFNQLVALNLKREGAIHWVVGGRHGWDEPELAESFFLGAPLPLDQRLYVLLEQRGEIQLAVLDSSTGQLIWRQQLAHVEDRDITNNAKRRLAGATPTYSNGVLICPTSAGAVVAINLATRSLLWGRQYQSPPRSTPSVSRSKATLGPLSQRWLDASVTAAHGKIILTPLESNVLICLDLLDGSRLWSMPRNDLIYVACVHEDRVIVVGSSGLIALDIGSGKAVWPKPVDLAGATPSGRGFRSGNRYFLPTSERELLEIDLIQGAIVDRVKTQGTLGNLIAFKDGIVSSGVDWISAFHQLAPLKESIDKRLEANPEDTWALSRQSEVLLQEGKRSEALLVLRKTSKIVPNNWRVRGLMVQTLIDALAHDFSNREQTESELRKLIDTPEDRASLLRLLASGHERAGNHELAIDALIELAEMPQEFYTRLSIKDDSLDIVSPVHRVQRERWIRTRISSLLSAGDSAQRRLDVQLPRRLQAARSEGVASLKRFVALFGPHDTANEARLELAAHIADRGQHLAAELLLTEVIAKGRPAQIALAEGLLAKVVRMSERLADAAIQYRRLRDHYADAIVADGLSGKEFFAKGLQDAALKPHLAELSAWPRGRTDTASGDIPGQVIQSYHKVYPFRLASIDGPKFNGLRLELDQNRAIIRVADNTGGQFQQVTLKERPRLFTNTAITLYGRTFGHLAVVSVGPNIYAVDSLSAPSESGGPVMWTHNLAFPLGQTTGARSTISARASANSWGVKRGYAVDQGQNRVGVIGPITPSGVTFLRLRELVCVNPISGETIWSRTDCPAGAELTGDDRHIVLLTPDTNVAHIFDARDGSSLGTRSAPGIAYRLATQGPNVLWWDEVPVGDDKTERILRLTNIVEQEHLYERRFASGSLGRVLDGEEFISVDPNGRFEAISLHSGKVLVESNVAVDERMRELLITRDRNAYYLGIASTASSPKEVYITNAPPASPPFYGRLYAISAKNGDLLWKNPADLAFFCMPEEQPSDSPVLVFLRHIRDRSRNSGVNQTSLLVLDRLDGRIVLFEPAATPQIGRYRVEVASDRRSVEITIHKRKFTLTLTDEPAPPAPVAHVHSPPARETTDPASGAPTSPFGRPDPFR